MGKRKEVEEIVPAKYSHMSFSWFFVSILSIISLQNRPLSLPKKNHHFVVIAHRGDHVSAPENTVKAYENAIQHGADYIEIDLRTSKDSALVIMHDATVNRMTDHKGKVSEFLLDSLRKMKVYNKEHPEFGSYHIPDFAEVLRLAKNKIHIYLDFKDASVKQAYQAIRNAGMEKQVIVYINSMQQLYDWRKIAPHMPLMISLPGNIKHGQDLKNLLLKYSFDLLDGSYTDYNTELLTAASQKNIPVWPDIQSADENPAIWHIPVSMGIRGLQTDHPEELIRYLTQLGLR
ncbi:MAG: glycerophosphodiester phosphodiesterase family protein [Bacteroidota bacterium]|nr:glycerophosphodiester phosphodiesterase family protein [Bacteroidota bacterium]